MTTHNKTSAEILNKAVTQKVTIAAAVGLLVVFVSWTIAFASQGIPFSITGIGAIHKANPTIWIINVLPLLFAILTHSILKRHQEKVSFLEEEIRQRDEDISKNALLPKQLAKVIIKPPLK